MARTEAKAIGEGSAAAPWLAFLAGVVLVAGIIAAFVFFSGGRLEAPSKTVNIEVDAPKIPEINMPNAPKLPAG